MIFSAFERMVSLRYLRARRQEGFISVIAGFSLLGIALGVATLIIVMAVMNGFREELLGRILGVNGHLAVYANGGRITDFDALSERLRKMDGVLTANPQIQGQVMVTSRGTATRTTTISIYAWGAAKASAVSAAGSSRHTGLG